MNWKQIREWLGKTTSPEDPTLTAQRLMTHLNSTNLAWRQPAEAVMARIAYYWHDFYSEEFVLAVLQALQAEASEPNAHVMTCVEHLSHEHARSPQERRVVEAARICSAALTAKWNLTHAQQELLRGSEERQAGREILVRPAHAGPETDPEELLRSSQEP